MRLRQAVAVATAALLAACGSSGTGTPPPGGGQPFPPPGGGQPPITPPKNAIWGFVVWFDPGARAEVPPELILPSDPGPASVFLARFGAGEVRVVSSAPTVRTCRLSSWLSTASECTYVLNVGLAAWANDMDLVGWADTNSNRSIDPGDLLRRWTAQERDGRPFPPGTPPEWLHYFPITFTKPDVYTGPPLRVVR